MNRRTINGILFDLGWTLERPADDDWTLTPCFFRHVPKDQFYRMEEGKRTKAMNDAMAPLLSRHFMVDMEEENQRFTEYYRDLNLYLSLGLSTETIEEIARDHTYNFANYVVFDSTRETLKALKEQGYRIGVLSDTWPSTIPQQKEAGLWDYYDFTVLSFELGVVKPHPKMYETAIAKMGVPSSEILYADDLVMSLAAAERFGMRCARSTAPCPCLNDEHYPCIRSPKEILPLLARLNEEVRNSEQP